MQHQPVSRRQVVRGLTTSTLALAGAALLAACGGTSATAPVATVAAAATASVPTSAATTAQQATTSAATAASSLSSITTTPTVSSATAAATAATTAATVPAPTPTVGIVKTGVTNAKVTLQWFSWFDSSYITKLQHDFLPAYEQSHPGVAIEVILGPGAIVALDQKVEVLTAAGSPPDLFNNSNPVRKYDQLDLFADLTPLIARDKFDTKSFNQPTFQYMAMDRGKVLGLPIDVHAEAVAMIANLDLFQKAGVPEPPATWGDAGWTWQSFLEAAQKLTVVGADGKLSQAGVDSLAYYIHLPVLWDGTWVSPDLKTATCDSQAMIDCYTSYYDLSLKYHVMPRPGEKLVPSGSAFASGKAALSVMGSWEFGAYRKLTQLHWAFVPFPKATRSAYVFDPDMEYIMKGSKHVDETWTFLQWLEAGSSYAKAFDFMPILEPDAGPWLKDFFQSMPDVRTDVVVQSLQRALPKDPLFLINGEDAFLPATIYPAMNDAAAGKVDAKAALQRIKGPLQQLVDQCGCSGLAG